MDIETMAATIGIVKKIPTTAAARAETAAESAEASADRAAMYGQAIDIVDGVIVIGEEE